MTVSVICDHSKLNITHPDRERNSECKSCYDRD